MQVRAGKGKHQIILECSRPHKGLAVLLTGGELRHVGAVVLSTPRSSLTGSGRASCDSYVIPVPGHKDHLLAQPVAEELCRLLGEPVSVTAGIHVDDACADDLRLLEENCRKVLLLAVEELRNESGDAAIPR